MTVDGKFILMDITEFETWLASKKVSRAINNLQMHHTWLPNNKSCNSSNHIALVKNMEAYHIKPKSEGGPGFSEIAQHFTTYPDGKICVCRDLGKDGAGISKRNTGGIVVENIGDFDTEQMTQKQREAIIRMSALLCKKYNIPMQINAEGNTMVGGVYTTGPTPGIKYHAWYGADKGEWLGDSGRGNNGAKTCPGKLFFGGTRIDTCKLAFIPAIQAWMSDYPDVPTSHWAYKFISSVSKADLLLGFDNGKFNPDRKITRSEVCIMIANLLTYKGLDVTKLNSISFTDVPATHPAYWFIQVTVSMGVMGGYVDFTFRPEDEITRAEMCVVINNLLRLLDKSYNSYSNTSGAEQRYIDVPVSHWGFQHIEITSRANVMGGYSGNEFRPSGKLTRAEAAVVAVNLMGK